MDGVALMAEMVGPAGHRPAVVAWKNLKFRFMAEEWLAGILFLVWWVISGEHLPLGGWREQFWISFKMGTEGVTAGSDSHLGPPKNLRSTLVILTSPTSPTMEGDSSPLEHWRILSLMSWKTPMSDPISRRVPNMRQVGKVTTLHS